MIENDGVPGLKNPLVIGVAGGTGSGKMTVVEKIVEELDSRDIIVLQHDSYYTSFYIYFFYQYHEVMLQFQVSIN